MPPEGSDLPAIPAGKTQVAPQSGNKSGNEDAGSGSSAGPCLPPDPDLVAVAAAWPCPPELRAGILALVKAAAN